ncbi:MAG: hypothetical protein V1910_02225 [bacterium]
MPSNSASTIFFYTYILLNLKDNKHCIDYQEEIEYLKGFEIDDEIIKKSS